MSYYKKYGLLFLLLIGITSINYAQSSKDTVIQKDTTQQTASSDTLKSEKALEESLSKAADAATKAADKIKIIVENKADKLAKTSQPYIESLAASTATLIEKLASELEKFANEKPVKKEE